MGRCHTKMTIKNKTSYLLINGVNINMQNKTGDKSYEANVITNNSFNKK